MPAAQISAREIELQNEIDQHGHSAFGLTPQQAAARWKIVKPLRKNLKRASAARRAEDSAKAKAEQKAERKADKAARKTARAAARAAR